MSTQAANPTNTYTVPSVSIKTAHTGATNRANALGMRTMQERAYAKRGEQYLLIKSPPASGKSRALMFIALDKLNNQGLQQAIVVVPERSIGAALLMSPSLNSGFIGIGPSPRNGTYATHLAPMRRGWLNQKLMLFVNF